jgi:hypothetical protein
MKRFWNNLHQVRSKSKDWRSNVFVSKKTPFFVGSMLFIFLAFCVVLLCVITFWVLCCDTSYDFRIKTMFDSSFPSVVCSMAHVLFTLCGCYSGIQHILCFFFFFFFRGLMYHILPISLDCPLGIVLSIFSNVYLMNYII